MARLLAIMNKGRLGTWARLELDSKEVVFVSVAFDTVRISSMKKRLLFWVPDQTLYEIPTMDAYDAFVRGTRPRAYPTDEGRREEFLGWLAGVVAAMPDT